MEINNELLYLDYGGLQRYHELILNQLEEKVDNDDSRLSDSRPASDVSSWAKASSKPSYTASEVGAIPSTEKGTASGVATLDSGGKVPSSQLPSITAAQVGLGNVGNFKAVSTEASQGLSSTEKANARANIGAGTSNFSGSYSDLSDKPTIPAAQVLTDWNATSGIGVLLNKPSSLPANGGNAATVGGHTVDIDVPSNAIFTDNNTTYQFELSGNTLKIGTNGGAKSDVYTPSFTAPVSSVNNKTGAVTLSASDVSAASSSHTHGNIQNGGTLQTNDVTISTGDKLVVTDNSDSSKVARTSLSFNSTHGNKFLRQDGIWAAPEYTEQYTGTITKVGNTTSGAVTVSSSNNSASWGNAVTVGTIGGVDLKFTMPSNPGGPDGNTQYYMTLNGSVTGTANTTNLGTIYAPTTAGTSGYYLKSSGSGAPTWAQFPTSLSASDVSSWAKASSKPSYTASEVGLGNVGNFKAVSTVANLGLSSTELSNARANIGAGTSSFSGNYNDLTNKPTIPAAQVQSDWNATSGMGVILNKPTIPTNTNQLTNGAGFISSIPTDYKKSYASVVTVSANTANVTCPSTLGDGDECTVIYANSGSTSDYSVTVSTDYVTPDGKLLDLTCPKSGYCEVNYLKIGSTIYARGV